METQTIEGLPTWDAKTLEGYDTSGLASGMPLTGSKNRQLVRFYVKRELEVYAKEATINPQGTPTNIKYDTREIERLMVHIITPGDKNEVNDVATDWHKREFFKQYQAFKQGKTAPLGTPLAEAAFIGPHVATELISMGCHTIEQLADGSDELVNCVADGWLLREYAKQYVKVQTDSKSLEQINALREQLMSAKTSAEESQAQLEDLRAEMAEMRSLLLDSKGNAVSSKKSNKKETKQDA